MEIKYHNLALSGGSTRGVAHIGALRKLIEHKMIDLKKLKALAGSSAGTLLGVLIVLGFDIDEIQELIFSLSMKKLIKPNLFMIIQKCGADSGDIIYHFYEEILSRKTNIKQINFKQLYEITKIHFTIVGSCLTTKEVVYFDHINYPLFEVSLAVRISISIPGLFIPVVIDNKTYIDAGLLNNYPINLFENDMAHTIGILIDLEYITDYKYPEEYFMAVMNLFMHHYYKNSINVYMENTVCIIIPQEKGFGVNFNFDVSKEEQVKLINYGIKGAEEFIKRISPQDPTDGVLIPVCEIEK